MRKYIVNLCKKNVFIRKVIRTIRYIVKKIRYNLFYKYIYKVNDNLVIFESYQGKNCACSPKELYLEMLNNKKYSKYKFIWCLKNEPDILKNDRTTIIICKGKEYYKAFSKAKYWIVNSLINEEITPKKNQVFVQCWHGTPLKRLRYDIAYNGLLNDTKELKWKNDIDARRYDYFISPSKFCTETFTSCFNLRNLHKENIIIEKGYPRNVPLFTFDLKKVEKIKKDLIIKDNRKIILYAPTFRDNQHTSGVGYTYKLGIDLDKLKKELEKDYIILFRTHYFVSNSIDLKKYKGFIYDVSKYDDINDLYIISDLLITDYSSVFFDYANLKRPVLFYMYDLDEYQNQLRDFYLDLDILPGPIVEKEEDLIYNIKNIDKVEKKYNKKYKEFNEKFNYLDDKDSSKRVLDVIFKEEK